MAKWTTVIKQKNEGGLELQKSHVKNTALLAKLAWKAKENLSSLWVATLLNKHTNTNELDIDTKAANHHSKIWKDLVLG